MRTRCVLAARDSLAVTEGEAGLARDALRTRLVSGGRCSGTGTARPRLQISGHLGFSRIAVWADGRAGISVLVYAYVRTTAFVCRLGASYAGLMIALR